MLRPRDLAAERIPRAVLSRRCEAGELLRTGRGLCVTGPESITENHTRAEVGRLAPRGFICLLSGLRFPELTQKVPGASGVN